MRFKKARPRYWYQSGGKAPRRTSVAIVAEAFALTETNGATSTSSKSANDVSSKTSVPHLVWKIPHCRNEATLNPIEDKELLGWRD
jgi:hypothetical protein